MGNEVTPPGLAGRPARRPRPSHEKGDIMSASTKLASLTGQDQDLTQDNINKIVDLARANPVETTGLATSFGDTLSQIFRLQPAEVKMLNALSADTVQALIALATRAAATGGTIQYTRAETGGPEFHISHNEVVKLKPTDGGPPRSIVNLAIRCMK
jgi:hypothetical protein